MLVGDFLFFKFFLRKSHNKWLGSATLRISPLAVLLDLFQHPSIVNICKVETLIPM